MHPSPDLLQRCEKTADLLAGADRDSHAPGELIAAVADQNPAVTELIANLDGPCPGLEQYEIGLAPEVRDLQPAESRVHLLTRGEWYVRLHERLQGKPRWLWR